MKKRLVLVMIMLILLITGCNNKEKKVDNSNKTNSQLENKTEIIEGEKVDNSLKGITKDDVKETKKDTNTTDNKKTESKTNTNNSNKSNFNNSKSNSNTSNSNSNNAQPAPAPSPSETPVPVQQNCTRPTENVIFLSQPCDAERGSSSCYRNDPVYQSQIEKYYHKERKDTEYWYALDRWRQYSVYTDGFQDPMMDSCGRWYGVRISVRLHMHECLNNNGCSTTPEYQSCIDTCWTDKSNYDMLDSCTNTCNSQYPNHIADKNSYWDSFTKKNGNIVGEYYVTSRGNVWYWNPNGLSF